jgi:hypothetical protein
MALSDTRDFLETLLKRYDPDVDLSDGSRAQVDLIDPILNRLGSDPFDEDITTFITTRIREVYPTLAITEDDALRDTVVDPMRVIIEPIVREVQLVKLRSSLNNIESLSDQEVDALLGNFFERRQQGGFAVGVVRAYFSQPQSVNVTLTNPATTRSGLRFFTTRPQTITADQMLLNVEGAEYYFDINYRAEQRGTEYNVEAGEINSITNLGTATRITNRRRFRRGAPRETSLEFAARSEASVGDKTLTVQRGIVRTLKESFPAITSLFSVGFGDPEMERDVIKGGSLGPIPGDDELGPFTGSATVVDDLDGDVTSPILETSTGFFVSRLAAAGVDPETWYVTVSYLNGVTPVFADYRITEVISESQIRVANEFPLAAAVAYGLRRRTLTISDIPGGIALPDSVDGNLEISPGEVHIGGKTDVYVAGEAENGSAQINGVTDETPVARGLAASTSSGSREILIAESTVSSAEIENGWSLVLDEGVDAGSYRIVSSTGSGQVLVTVERPVTGTQSNLSWRIVDDITVDLTDPKSIKLTGADLVVSAGSPTVTTASSANFIDANVQTNDIVRITGQDTIEGDYTVLEVNAVTLTVDPAVPRTASAVSYQIFTRSEALSPPFLRVSSIELLDSGGSPVGTEIPYRDPVLAESRAFQNEGDTFSFEGTVAVGLVSGGFAPTAALPVGGAPFTWETYTPSARYAGTIGGSTHTLAAGTPTVAQIVDELNTVPAFQADGLRAILLSFGGLNYLGIASSNLVLLSGAAPTALGFAADQSNATIRTIEAVDDFALIQRGDAVEVLEGNSSGATGRVLENFTEAGADFLRLGSGPQSPVPGAYDNVVLNPDVGVRVRVGRASVGSARLYFQGPTSTEVDYRTARFTLEGTTRGLVYQPDPENQRVVRPPPPFTDLPNQGVTGSGVLTDASVDFEFLEVSPGDILEVLYRPIQGVVALPSSGTIAVTGQTLILRFDSDPFITVAFPTPLTRSDIVDYINERVGVEIASLYSGGRLQLQSKSRRIEISADSSAFATLLDSSGFPTVPFTNDHPEQGSYIIAGASANDLTISSLTPISIAQGDTQYRILRYVQRVSSTEMNENQDATQLYYQDVELRSVAPGNEFNVDAGLAMEVTGVRADGYRVTTDNPVLTFSRAEVAQAEISRTILLPGSSDSPEEYVQISQQNIQVNYDRSQLVDEVQSFGDSDFERVITQEILAKHLLPHYVSLNWAYVAGPAKSDGIRALNEAIDAIEPDTEFEVLDLVDVLRSRGSSSVYTVDNDAVTGRRAPIMVVVYHDTSRVRRAVLVRDFVNAVRAQKFIPDSIEISRVSAAGIVT